MPSDLKTNTSGHSLDRRTVTRIIFEKANFGAVPTQFKLRDNDETDSRMWHPVHWQHNPDLEAIQFTDGSIVYVDVNHNFDNTDPHIGLSDTGHRFDVSAPRDETEADAHEELESGLGTELELDVAGFLGSKKFDVDKTE